MESLLVQVISIGPADSRTIEDCSAHRIQLVSALEIGGVTPSNATIRRSLQTTSIPNHVIIRPHNNGFVFSSQEKDLMIEDIIRAKQQNCHGVVIGGLIKNQEQHEPDYQFVEQILKQVGGKINVVFHKASDHVNEFGKSLNKLFDMGVTHILTQGGQKPLLGNIQKFKEIDKKYYQRILLGGGINHQNKRQIVNSLNPSQIHIGTCVRNNRYGEVNHSKLMQFMEL